MKATIRRQLASRKRRILRRIENQPGVERHQPMMTASNIHYEIADRTRAISEGIWKLKQPAKPQPPLFVKLGNIGTSVLIVGP